MTAGSGFRRKEGRDGGINREEWGGKEGSESFIVDPLVEFCQWPNNCLNFRVLSFIQSVFFFFVHVSNVLFQFPINDLYS